MTSDLARWRADTPGCAERIHLNNAGASLMPRPVIDAVTTHLEQESRLGGYEAADAAAPQLEATYQALADLLKAAPRNIAIVESATTGFAQALSAFDFRPGDVIVTTRADYVSNQLMLLSLSARHGVVVRRAADLPEGGVDPDSVRTMVNDRRPRLVALTWVPTNSGMVQDAAAVGAACEAAGVPYLIDACQALGQVPIDVTALHCDYLSTTARKFLRGPRGVGFLFASDRALARGDHPLLVDMRGADWTGADLFQLADGARRFEYWERSCALALGLGAAARYSLQVGAAGFERASALAAGLRRRLAAVPGVRTMDWGRQRGAIVTVATDGVEPTELKRRLRARGVNTSVSDHEDAVIDFDAKGVRSVLRFSPHYYNTEEELDSAVAALQEEMQK